ncbi:MAG: adenylate kinase [Pirellulaceae bacterium]|nr:adenylate kinase [Pirellulaceae bacterium]
MTRRTAMYVVLIGRPGVGKGTQAQRLVDELGLSRISTGEMLRETIRSGGEENQKIAQCIDGGNLAADDMIMKLVENRLGEPGFENSCLFDGIPRTVAQAEALDELLRRRNTKIDVAVEVSADADELVARILERAKIENRADDNLKAIRQRMDVYTRSTEPILEYYRERGVLRSVDGLGTRDEVFDRIRSCIVVR